MLKTKFDDLKGLSKSERLTLESALKPAVLTAQSGFKVEGEESSL